MKACPLVPVLRLLADAGLGCEVASPGELALARAAGVPADRIVWTPPPRRRASCARPSRWASPSTPTASRSSAASTASSARPPPPPRSASGSTRRPARAPSAPCPPRRPPRSSGSRCATPARASGSYGPSWSAVADPPARPLGLAGPAPAADRGGRAGAARPGRGDQRGGRRPAGRHPRHRRRLPVNFASDEESPTHAAYAAALREAVPALFDGSYGWSPSSAGPCSPSTARCWPGWSTPSAAGPGRSR